MVININFLSITRLFVAKLVTDSSLVNVGYSLLVNGKSHDECTDLRNMTFFSQY